MTVELPSAWRSSPRRVLVTGCGGFLGSSLTDALLAGGHDVVGVDCFTDYYDPARKRRNLSDALLNPGFRLLEADLNDLDLSDVLADRQVCFHMAAQAGVRASWGREFDIYLAYNIRATQNLLEAMLQLDRADGESRCLVYSSSSSVYGNQPTYPVVETSYLQPFSPYGVTKLAAEHLCGLYAENFGLRTTSLRYFTVYGPRQRPDMAFQKFLEAARAGQPWKIYGDGSQTRDFTFVADALRANLLAADSPRRGAVYNVGGGSRIALRDALAILRDRAVAHGLADDIQIEYGDRVEGDVIHTYADGQLARDELGFAAGVSLEDGLDAQVRWNMRGEPAA